MREFKVFYSWQSDLPGNKTRYLIQNCIDEAIEKCGSSVNGITFVADRDTKGLTGSPSIPQTILSKIDECDLFIADVSLVNKYNCFPVDEASDSNCDSTKNGSKINDNKMNKSVIKYTPNPNVLIELGYAVKRLGWERIICFINTDYGSIDELPFDLEHQRVTPFSLVNKTRKEAINQLRPILVETIIEFASKPSLPKKGKALHRVGTYNLDAKLFDDELVSYNVRNCPWIEMYFDQQKNKARELIAKIQSINFPFKHKKSMSFAGQDVNSIIASIKNDNNLMDYSVPSSIIEEIIRLSEIYLEENTSIFNNAFFNVGDIKTPIVFSASDLFGRPQPIPKYGDEEELDKDQQIQELFSVLEDLELIDLYLKSFDDIVILPLAIENISSESDSDIEIIVMVEGDTEAVWPAEDLIPQELQMRKVDIYQSDFIRCALVMVEKGDIKYDGEMWYDNTLPFNWTGGIREFAEIHDSDYEEAIELFIACPVDENVYSFKISSLKAGEKKWLGAMIALKKNTDKVKLTYRIISDKTDGNNEGELIYSGNSR